MYGSIFIILVIVSIAIWRVMMSSPDNIGKAGERWVSHKLNWLPKEYIVLNDIMLPSNYGTTQIDHIVVSPYGIFVIETKNYKGWIFGNEDSEEWTQSLIGRKKMLGWSSEQHRFRNPIRQNYAHIKAVQNLLSDIGDFTIIPIVVFSDNATLKITTNKYIVTNWGNLRCIMFQFNKVCIPEQQIQPIVDKINLANIKENESREQHTSSVQSLKEQKHRMIANRICPKCHSTLVERNGRYGRFLGCSNYPNCKFTSPLE